MPTCQPPSVLSPACCKSTGLASREAGLAPTKMSAVAVMPHLCPSISANHLLFPCSQQSLFPEVMVSSCLDANKGMSHSELIQVLTPLCLPRKPPLLIPRSDPWACGNRPSEGHPCGWTL